VVIDALENPLGILQLHLILLVALGGNLLLVLPLSGRCAIMARLLLLLIAELLHKLLDLPVLLRVVVPGVMYWAPRTALITVGGLSQSLITTWAMAPASHSSISNGSRSTSQWLVVADGLLLLLFVFVAALSSDICIKPADFPYLWGKL
jgi:hypothetical protein